MLGGLVAELDEAGLGSISEVFDAEAPFTPEAVSPRPGGWRNYSDAGSRRPDRDAARASRTSTNSGRKADMA
jgi:hypothetical protein